MTAEQLASLPDDGMRYELVQGVLHMMSPAGGRHGRIAARLLYFITRHVLQHDLGATFAAETGFLLHRNPDTVRAPDVAFVSHQRLGLLADHNGYLPLAPDLAAEVVSFHDTPAEVEAKAWAWLDAGVAVVLVVDPRARNVREYRLSEPPVRVHSAGEVDLSDVVPGFRLELAELFA